MSQHAVIVPFRYRDRRFVPWDWSDFVACLLGYLMLEECSRAFFQIGVGLYVSGPHYSPHEPVRYGGSVRRAPSREHYLAVLRVECARSGVPLARALTRERSQRIALTRMRAWRSLVAEGYGIAATGRVAGVDHTTIISGLRRLKALGE